MEQEVKTVVRKSIPLDKIFALPSKMSYNKFLNKINRDLNIYAHNSA